ncbi:MAG: hypothetical protein R2707_20095 [Acidimicrobiales bacterium]
MSPDRVVYSFVLGWIVLLAVLIALDWLGNPNRGAFRPKGERPPNDRATRKAERARRRLEDDASVRAALRDAYGASSLRFTWTSEHETRARQLDDALVVDERIAVDVTSREIASIDRTAIIGDPLPNIDGADEPDDDEADEADDDVDDDEPAPGWSVGGDPLALTARGTEPAPGTIRSRVWKNHGLVGAWSEENRSRLAAGKAPRRVNPITGRHERAAVDIETGRASWGSEPIDPFGTST